MRAPVLFPWFCVATVVVGQRVHLAVHPLPAGTVLEVTASLSVFQAAIHQRAALVDVQPAAEERVHLGAERVGSDRGPDQRNAPARSRASHHAPRHRTIFC
jgi:hypothetical protein